MRFHELFEYHRKNSAKKWKTALGEISSNTDPEETLKEIEKGDPTDDKTYMQWIISQLRETPVLINDMNHMYDLLKSYEDYKPRLPEEQQDIYKLNYQQVFDIIDKIDNPEVDFENTKETDLNINGVNQDEYSVIYDGPLGRLVVPKTKNAACVLGHGTKWCITSTNTSDFYDYASEGPIYIWHGKNGKYSFHFESIEFVDVQDKAINQSILKNWRNNHPVLKRMFKIGEKNLGDGISDNMAYMHNIIDYINDVMEGERLPKESEDALLGGGNTDFIIKYIVAIGISLETEMLNQMENNNMNAGTMAAYIVEVLGGKYWPEFEKVLFKKEKAVFYDSMVKILIHATYYSSSEWPSVKGLIERMVSRYVEDNGNIDNELIGRLSTYATTAIGINLSQWKEIVSKLPDQFRQ